MHDDKDPDRANPMNHPDEQPAGSDDAPKFGRLLIVLVLAVAFLGLVTWASQAWLVD
ncbi:MAG: hypothetical protein JWP36_1240 [Paucimonas sp.]|nr:hypothetical protein [Paucimonas sp.]